MLKNLDFEFSNLGNRQLRKEKAKLEHLIKELKTELISRKLNKEIGTALSEIGQGKLSKITWDLKFDRQYPEICHPRAVAIHMDDGGIIDESDLIFVEYESVETGERESVNVVTYVYDLIREDFLDYTTHYKVSEIIFNE